METAEGDLAAKEMGFELNGRLARAISQDAPEIAREWARRMKEQLGVPEYLSPQQVEQLKVASRLVKEPIGWKFEEGVVHLNIDLPPHAVAAVTLEFAAK